MEQHSWNCRSPYRLLEKRIRKLSDQGSLIGRENLQIANVGPKNTSHHKDYIQSATTNFLEAWHQYIQQLHKLNNKSQNCQMFIAMYCKGIIWQKEQCPSPADEMCFYIPWASSIGALKQLIQNDGLCQISKTMLCQGSNVDLAIFSPPS